MFILQAVGMKRPHALFLFTGKKIKLHWGKAPYTDAVFVQNTFTRTTDTRH